MASELILGPRSGAGSAASPRPRRLPSTAGAVLLLLLAGAVAPAPAGAGDDWIPDNYPVRFLMLGDWGRATEADPGGFNQSMVADRMAQLAAERQFFLSAGPSFVLSTGDNFYKVRAPRTAVAANGAVHLCNAAPGPARPLIRLPPLPHAHPLLSIFHRLV